MRCDGHSNTGHPQTCTRSDNFHWIFVIINILNLWPPFTVVRWPPAESDFQRFSAFFEFYKFNTKICVTDKHSRDKRMTGGSLGKSFTYLGDCTLTALTLLLSAAIKRTPFRHSSGPIRSVWILMIFPGTWSSLEEASGEIEVWLRDDLAIFMMCELQFNHYSFLLCIDHFTRGYLTKSVL